MVTILYGIQALRTGDWLYWTFAVVWSITTRNTAATLVINHKTTRIEKAASVSEN